MNMISPFEWLNDNIIFLASLKAPNVCHEPSNLTNLQSDNFVTSHH